MSIESFVWGFYMWCNNLALPQSCTLVHSVTKLLDPFVPVKHCPIGADGSIINVNLDKEYKWLANLLTMLNKCSLDNGDYASWTVNSANGEP